MAEEEAQGGPPEIDPGSPTGQAAPVARAFLCRRCRRGRLDPAGLSLGENMTCPECGALAQVTLEHVMGEERATRREKARKTFEEMTDEEKAEYLAGKGALERLLIFVRHRLGPKGMAALYLGLLVVVVLGVIFAKLSSGGYRLRAVSWWVVVLWIVGGALAGVIGHFSYVTIMYHYKKHLAQQGQGRLGSRRLSARRSSRSKKPDAGEGGGGQQGGPADD
jgi:hypothetical protein